MRIGKLAGVITVGFLLMVSNASKLEAGEQAGQPVISSGSEARAVLDQYCVICHSDRLKTAGLSLESVDLDDAGTNWQPLEQVVRKLRVGAMPPVGRPRPSPATYTALTRWLETTLDQVALARPTPGRTESLHRLNRAEYQNVIRDLLHLEGLDFATLLPGDDASYGFDNIAGVLGMTSTHLERYLDAARTISRMAVGDVTLLPTGETHMVPSDLSQDDRFVDLPFGSRGGVRVRRYFPVDAEYMIRFQAFTGVGTSADEANHIELSVDGERVFFEQMEQTPHMLVEGPANTDWEVRIPIKAGLRDIGVTFAQTTFAQLEDFLQPYLRPPGVSTFKLTRVGGYAGPYVSQLSFMGPLNPTGPGDTPSRQRIFVCRPANVSEELPCARQTLSTLARRAYRRPVTDDDLEPLLAQYLTGRASGGFEKGIQVALVRLLASPDFLFRLERDPANIGPGTAYQVSDLELASRLSFFLWSSIPDDELLDLATRGELSDPIVLERQTRRMLADERSQALVSNVAGQWLRLRNVDAIDPNVQMFPNFGGDLRRAMRRETELFFDSIVREDRSVRDLLSADYTFVNERLARHYGIPNVYGNHFRRVSVTDENRRGLLGHASILTVTSQSNRTSPVVRGKWILENLLGAPPPAPPDEVPALEATKLEGTLRQRMEQHRRNPVCAACHNVMDPLGFALENFDALGRWRDKDAGLAVDAAGAMPDGTAFDGSAGLRAALLARSEVFVSTLTEKLLIYALGRGLEYFDAPAVREIMRVAAKDDDRFSSLILGIVTSAPFQMRSAASPEPQPEAVADVAQR